MKIRGLTAAVYAFKTPLIFHEWIDEQQRSWSFRTAWVITDLRPAYSWLNDAYGRTNYPLAWRKAILMHRFKQRLQSRNQQVFVIDRDGAPLLVLEVLPVERTDIPLHAPLPVSGWAIYYLMPAEQQTDSYWPGYASEIITAARLREPKVIFNIEIPPHATELKRMLAQLGFTLVSKYVNSTGIVELFRG